MEIKLIFKRLLMVVALIIMTTSCGIAKFRDVARNIQFGEITSVEMKGLTGVQVSAEVGNASSSTVAMEQGVITLYDSDKVVATLRQVGVVESAPDSQGEVRSMWKIEGVEAFALLGLTVRIAQSQYDGMSVAYEAVLKVDDREKKVSGRRVDIEKILSTFVR